MKLIGVSGSLRNRSYNTALLRAAADALPDGTTLTVETIHGIPLYDADLEAAEGLPERVRDLKASIAAAQGVILATPEYNNSIPGPFKNAIDWLSRPPGDIPKVFGDKPLTIVGASPGGFGTILSQNAWLPVLRTLGVRQWFGNRLLLSRAGDSFDENGQLVDQGVKERLRNHMSGFVKFISTA